MPFDGFGTFIRLRSWIVDATNSVKIRADFHDDEDNNFAAGLSQCITKDGQTIITQNIPLNSRRIVSLADPIDPQDAATKDYADTKMPLDGSVPITGDVTVKNDDPTITLDGKDGSKNSIYGDKAEKHRWEIVLGNATAEAGGDVGSDFELINYHDDGTLIGDVLFGSRATGLMTVKGDPTAALGIATKQIVDTKLPLAGGTMTGELVLGTKVLRFGTPGSPGYLQWNSAGDYTLGGGGTIWHSGNFNPTTSVVTGSRLIWAGDREYLTGAWAVDEPYPGGVVTSAWAAVDRTGVRWRYLQHSIGGTWYTVGYV